MPYKTFYLSKLDGSRFDWKSEKDEDGNIVVIVDDVKLTLVPVPEHTHEKYPFTIRGVTFLA